MKGRMRGIELWVWGSDERMRRKAGRGVGTE
jgi:hypothetical protein